MKPHVNHLKSAACILGVLLLVGCETNKPTAETATTQPQAVSPQQVPIPTTAAEVPGPAPGPMTKSYVETVGRVAYLWGWPLVYVYNQRTALTHVPAPGLLAGALPVAPMNLVVMLTDYISPGETYIADPNQDVVYGLGYLSLEKEPLVIQVPDFGSRFWTIPIYNARTAIRHQTRFLHGGGAELERHAPGRNCQRGALIPRTSP